MTVRSEDQEEWEVSTSAGVKRRLNLLLLLGHSMAVLCFGQTWFGVSNQAPCLPAESGEMLRVTRHLATFGSAVMER